MRHDADTAAAFITSVDEHFVAAARLTAERLDGIDSPRGYITEREHLQPTFKAALTTVAATSDPPPLVSPTLALPALREHFTKVGSFDVSLEWPAGTAYGELKAGVKEDLGHCAWDALKCATARAGGYAASTLLVAAMPKTSWSPTALGAELLHDGQWDVLHLRERYEAWFSYYERKDAQWPLRVIARLRTVALAQAEFTACGRPWAIAVARVEPNAWLDWPRFNLEPPPDITPGADNGAALTASDVDGPVVEHHPYGYRWRQRFPTAEILADFEGGAVYAAQGEGAFWVIKDEGTMVDFLDPQEDASLLESLVKLQRFGSRDAWERECRAWRSRGRTGDG
jgi:hypothetical protein